MSADQVRPTVRRVVGRRVRLKDKMPLVGWKVATRNRLTGTVVRDVNYSTATVRIAASDSWDGKESESDHAKTDLTLLCPPNPTLQRSVEPAKEIE